MYESYLGFMMSFNNDYWLLTGAPNEPFSPFVPCNVAKSIYGIIIVIVIRKYGWGYYTSVPGIPSVPWRQVELYYSMRWLVQEPILTGNPVSPRSPLVPGSPCAPWKRINQIPKFPITCTMGMIHPQRQCVLTFIPSNPGGP